MKKRLGFVSNSSSSSFVCDICGNSASGMDLTYSDCDFVCDDLGFEFCEEHLEEDVITEVLLQDKEKYNIDPDTEDDNVYSEFLYQNRDSIPKEFSPIFHLETIPNSVLLRYVLKNKYKDKTELVDEIKSTYNDMDEINNYLEGN